MDYNVKILKYANNRQQIVFYSVPIRFKEKIEYNKIDQRETKDYDLNEEEEENKKLHSLMNSRNRTIKNIYSIARANNWEWFVTFTFDPKRFNSTNYDSVMAEMSHFMKNLRRKNIDMKYMLIPELHEDHKKYHVHGLLSGLPDCYFEYWKHEDGKDVYIMKNYILGRNYHTRVENNDAVTRYITKYITKDLMESTKNKHRFLYSLNCDKPREIKLKTGSHEFLFDKIKGSVTYTKSIEYNDTHVIYFECQGLENYFEFENTTKQEFKQTIREFAEV